MCFSLVLWTHFAEAEWVFLLRLGAKQVDFREFRTEHFTLLCGRFVFIVFPLKDFKNCRFSISCHFITPDAKTDQNTRRPDFFKILFDPFYYLE